MISFENTNEIKRIEGLGFTLFLVEFYREAFIIEVCNQKMTVYYPWYSRDNQA